MARTKSNQQSAVPALGQAEARMPASPVSLCVLAAAAITAVWAAAMLTASGRIVYGYLFFFMEFFGGVFTLVSLTMTVVGGLVATDRILLQVRHRVLLQSVHRFTAVLAMIFLVLHIMTKTSMGRAAPLDAFLPFAAGAGLYVGLGTIASYLMLSVFFTGILRARFVHVGPPWMWRALHSSAYLAWPVAIMHGLTAGRQAATWVTASYLACVALVTVGLLARLAVGSGRRLRAQTTDTMKPIGRLSPAVTPIAARPAAPPRSSTSASSTAAGSAAGSSAAGVSAAGAEAGVPATPRRSAASGSRAPVSAPTGSRTPVSAPTGSWSPVSAPPGASRRAARDRSPAEARDYAPAEARDYPPTESREYRAGDTRDYAPDRDYSLDETGDYGGRGFVPPRMTFFRPRATRARRQESFSAPVPDEARQQSEFGMAVPEPPRRRSADEYLTGDSARHRSGGDYGGPESRRGRSSRHSAPPEYEPEVIELGVLERDAGRRDGGRRRAERREAERKDSERRREAGLRDADRPAGEPRRDGERRRDGEGRWDGERRWDAAERRESAGRRETGRREHERLEAERRDRERADVERRERADAERRDRERLDIERRFANAGSARDYEYSLDDNYLPPDDTPTLVDMAARRERRAAREAAGKSSRSTRRRRAAEEDADVQYWRELRGQAQ